MNVLGKGSESTIIKLGNLAKKKTNQNEIDVIIKLGYHPNIIQPEIILGTSIYMPIADTDLFDYCLNQHPLSEKINIFSQVVKGVDWCHANGVIHHDIKLENILLFGNTAVLIDFGLSVITNTKISRKKIIGTQEYIAPEIIDKKPYDHSIDIYSLGILFFLLVTEKQPWCYAENTDRLYYLFTKNKEQYWKWFDKHHPTDSWFKDLFADIIIDRIHPIEILKRIKTLDLDKND